MELITQSELAKRVGKSKQYIAKLKQKGIFDKCFHGKKLVLNCALKAMEENIKDFKKTDPRQFKKEIQKSIPKEIPPAQADEMIGELEILLAGVDNPVQKVAVIKDFWNGKLSQIKYETERKKYILLEDVKEQSQKVASVVRQRLFNVPVKVASLCYGKEIAEIQELIYDGINEAVEDLHGEALWKK